MEEQNVMERSEERLIAKLEEEEIRQEDEK